MQVKAKAAERVLSARLQRSLQSLGWEPITDPIHAYADLGGETWMFKELARARVNELNSWEQTGAFGVEDIAAAIQVYLKAVDAVERIISRMIGFGLDREALRIAAEKPTREQADVLVAAMNRLLADPRVVVTGDVRAVVLDAIREVGAQ